MAEKAKKKNNKNLIIGICAGVLVIAVVVVAIIFATKGTTPAINDAYFVSDGTKYVITLDEDEIESEDEEATPVKTHIVYTHASESGIASMSTNGKYLVIVATEDQYADTTVSEVKQYVEMLDTMKNAGTNDAEDEDYIEEDIEVEDEE